MSIKGSDYDGFVAVHVTNSITWSPDTKLARLDITKLRKSGVGVSSCVGVRNLNLLIIQPYKNVLEQLPAAVVVVLGDG